ncbi:hypothetical protein DAPPUDRAFT_104588 [Daphnia pulex]|uniref:Uncharacterized protein n=1 Tax=Daphnia pulex TaxID=6669 RepID=E9GMP8_DAPPU|nr:hypothetical protein DAPPUDRAFT_104588 [Daphnia pulex]|eukprot:EFX79135.1 hypothetical protein DAPPUDRAFT_104588 [Daphnia pulex]
MEMSSMVTTVGSEVTVYGAVGAVFLFLLVALLLGLSFSSPCKSGDNGKYLSNSSNLGYDRDQMDCNYSPDGFAEWGHSLSTMELMPTPPPVIYTEQLARDIEGDCVGLEQLLKKPSHFMSLSNSSSSRSPLTTTTDHSSTLAEFHHHHQQRYQNPDDSLYCHNHSASRS